MSVAAFVDTNILVYADDHAYPDKRRRAQDVIRTVIQQGDGWLSIQVLQEYFSVATRKLGLDVTLARRRVEIYSRLQGRHP